MRFYKYGVVINSFMCMFVIFNIGYMNSMYEIIMSRLIQADLNGLVLSIKSVGSVHLTDFPSF